ncbi:MAG: chain-length determining protein [Rhodobacteraceae bacterium]|nr:chain-length determining protein [Paracoccaceae bacterium]
MEKMFAANEILAMLRRHFVIFALILGSGVAASFMYALSLPRLYETSAVIQIETPPLSTPISAGSRETSRAMQQLLRTEQRLMARDHLIRIINEYDLFADRPGATQSDKVLALRLATRIEQVTNPTLQWRTDITPTALTVTVRLGDPNLAADIANEFVDSVLEHNKKSRSQRVRETLDFFESEATRVGAEIAALETEIAAFKHANAGALPEALIPKRTQLVTLEETDLELEQQLVELIGANASGVRTAIAQQIAQVEERRAVVAEKRAALEADLAAAPEVEKQYNKLRRHLAQLEEQFTVITRQRAEAEMGQMLEYSSQSENYEVLERAPVPDMPIAPSRRKTFVMGLAASFAAAIAVVFTLENLKPVLRNAAQMERQLGIRPVVVIPNIETTGEFARRRVYRALIAVAMIFALSVSLMAINRYVFRFDHFISANWLPGGVR